VYLGCVGAWTIDLFDVAAVDVAARFFLAEITVLHRSPR